MSSEYYVNQHPSSSHEFLGVQFFYWHNVKDLSAYQWDPELLNPGSPVLERLAIFATENEQ